MRRWADPMLRAFATSFRATAGPAQVRFGHPAAGEVQGSRGAPAADGIDLDDDSCPAARDIDQGSTSQVRPMFDLPGPAGWPVVGNFFSYLKKENRGRMHIVQMEMHRKYGKMFRERWGNKWELRVADPDSIEQVYRREGRYPHRPGPPPWLLHRELSKKPPGVLIAQGPQWQRLRQVLGKELLSRDIVIKLSAPIVSVTDDFITRMREVRDASGDRAVVDQLSSFVYRWTFEAAGTFMFETRLGCLDSVVPPRTVEFVGTLHDMFETSIQLMIGDRLHKALNTKLWRRHKDAWDKLFALTGELVDEKLAQMEKGGGTDGSAMFLTLLLRNKDIGMEEIYSNMLDLLNGAIDTTANTYCFLVHLLATNPDVQQRLYDEIIEVIQSRLNAASADDPEAAARNVLQFKYLNCVIKEGLRLYPTVALNGRILEEDTIISGYLIPKKTRVFINHYAASRDPDVFEEPDRFMPERWMRSGTRLQSQKHPFASLPFGSGGRSCLGRRISKMELATNLVKTLTNFKLEPYPGMEFQPTMSTLLQPGKQLPVLLVDRSAAQLDAMKDCSKVLAAAAANLI